MRAANAASGQELDAGAMRDPNCRCDRRRTIPLVRHSDSQVARADLLDVVPFGNLFDLILIETDTKLAIENRDRGRSRAGIVDDLFEPLRCLKVLRARQAVRYHGRFQRDYGAM